MTENPNEKSINFEGVGRSTKSIAKELSISMLELLDSHEKTLLAGRRLVVASDIYGILSGMATGRIETGQVRLLNQLQRLTELLDKDVEHNEEVRSIINRLGSIASQAASFGMSIQDQHLSKIQSRSL